MKVSTVRMAVQAHEQLWWWSRLFYGEWARISALQEIIAPYSLAPNTELNEADEYKVVQIISAASSYPELNLLRKSFPTDLIILYKHFDALGCMDEALFHQLKNTIAEFNRGPLFGVLQDHAIMYSPSMALAARHIEYLQPLYRLILLLHDYTELNPYIFNLLLAHINLTPEMDWWLNDYFFRTFASVGKNNGIDIKVTQLIVAFTRADQAVIDELALFKLQFSRRMQRGISHTVFYRLLYSSVEKVRLYHQVDSSFLKLERALSTWQACLDFDPSRVNSIAIILRHLSDGWDRGDVTRDILKGLDKCLAVPTDFVQLADVLESYDKKIFNIKFILMLRIQHSTLLFSEIVKLLAELHENQCVCSDAELQRIVSLNEKRLNEFLILLKKARDFGVLEPGAIETILASVENRLQKVPVTPIRFFEHEIGDELSTESASYYYVDPNFNLPQSEDSLVGGYGVVGKVLKAGSHPSQFFAAKLMNVDKHGINQSRIMAKREVRYNNFLGRDSHYCANLGEVYVLMPWYDGIELDHVSDEVLSGIPVDVRLLMLIDMLEDLKKLHQRHRAHGDIKTQNIIFDVQTKKLHLIDLNSAHREMSKKSYPFTPSFIDKDRKHDNNQMTDDIYTLSTVFEKMFPELSNNSENPAIIGIGNFIADLMECTAEKRAVIGEVIEFMQYLHAEYAKLSKEDVLLKLESVTYQSKLTLEDVLGGRTQLSMR